MKLKKEAILLAENEDELNLIQKCQNLEFLQVQLKKKEEVPGPGQYTT